MSAFTGPLGDVTRYLEHKQLPIWYGNWAHRNGKLAYFFTDEYGDSECAFYCADCAEKHVRTRYANSCPYNLLETIVAYEQITCDDCGEDLSN